VAERQGGREAGRQRGREAERQGGRVAEREAEKQSGRERQRERQRQEVYFPSVPHMEINIQILLGKIIQESNLVLVFVVVVSIYVCEIVSRCTE